jgi:hypothetical protein
VVEFADGVLRGGQIPEIGAVVAGGESLTAQVRCAILDDIVNGQRAKLCPTDEETICHCIAS